MALELEPWQTLAWPASRLGEALERLAPQRRSHAATVLPAWPNLSTANNEELGQWIDVMARHLDLEVEAVEATYSDIDRLVQGAHPALLRLPGAFDTDEPRFLALLKRGWWRISVIGADHKVYRLDPRRLRDALCYDMEATTLTHIDACLTRSGTATPRQPRPQPLARDIIMHAGLGATLVGCGWLVRPLPNAPLRSQARYERLLPRLLVVLSMILLWQMLLSVSWLIIGHGVFRGHFDWGWFLAWMLVIFTISAVQWFVYTYQGKFFASVGRVFKPAFLFGAMQLEPDDIRHLGAGQFLARVMHASRLESTVLARGMNVVIYVFMLLLAGVLLGFGAGGWLHAGLLLAWMLLLGLMSWYYFRLGKEWVTTYRHMTNGLVERMVGHRTRLIQEHPEDWHTEEDQTLQNYLHITERLNRIETLVESLIPQGWPIVGLAGIAQPFVRSTSSPVELALSIGGIIFAFQAFLNLTRKFSDLLDAMLAWEQVRPLLQAATRTVDNQFFRLSPGAGQPLVQAMQLVFRYPSRVAPILQGCHLQIHHGDRLLLEGPSGGGKSTLAALLSGLYPPESGILLLWGIDRRTMGTRTWRKRVVNVPQFQENHVMSETFGFNLFMGHRWPPLPEDVAEAKVICGELGLGDVLDRMPDGFDQQLGDSGWQLSHGERSRLYIARALLQQPDLLILDESFGALDPDSLHMTMQCILNRTATLLVIAHP
ncbi:hypothetical protein NKDENANG_00336 [Candidatus Entotheonellaceae bacterium PAL068K]